MPTVAAVYTAMSVIPSIQALFSEILPDVRLINIADSSLIEDITAAGAVTPAVTRRLVAYWQAAAQTGADVILNTCSSTGELVALGAEMLDVPLIQIDHAMAELAVRHSGASIGVLATLPTSLGPIVRLLARKAEEAGTQVRIVQGVAEGAYEALAGGRSEEHDQRILAAAQRLVGQVDVFVLTQASMGRMQGALAAHTNRPVLTSPRLGVMAVARALGREA